MSEKSVYAGKIKSGGTQNIQAPYSGGGRTKGNVRISGDDLRSGNKNSGK
ncbi:MAG: hypothetical protein MJ074_06695 [Oscillospiraceae bacterium]|nr:hypothetical protein [Oscillospiraceae bacterium]